MLVLCLTASPLTAQVPSASEPNVEEEEQEQPVLDLGTFRVEELRPTRNETIKVTFTAHLVLEPKLSEVELETLQNFHHRLRDQIIVAVRTAHTKDFREPGLDRLRRLIQIRVEQLLRAQVTENLLISEYQFTLD